MPLCRLAPPGELVEADSIRDEGRTVVLIGTALLMNRPRGRPATASETFTALS